MKKNILLILVIIGLNLSAQIQFIKIDSSIFRQMQEADMDWGDYDNDGDLDILLAGLALNGGTISTESYIYRNDGNNIFTNTFSQLPQLRRGTARWSDIDNDGKLDILLTGTIGSSGNSYTKLCINKGGANFEVVSPDLPNADYGSFCNLNNDGLPDIILYHYGLNILINNGDYTFSEITIDYPENANNIYVSVGDFNNDNFDDFLITGTGYIGGQNHTYNYIYKNNQTNTFTKIDFEPLQNIVPNIAWQDLDSDGDIDIIYSGNSWDTQDPITVIYENIGNENFSESSHNIPAVAQATYSFADYTNNGFNDIVISGYFPNDQDATTHMFVNQGNWDFDDDSSFDFEPDNIFDVNFADIDGDKDLDMGVTVRKHWGRLTYICENNSNGNYNSIPDIPQQLVSEINSNQLLLSWSLSTDIETPTEALTYNMYLQRGEQTIINPNSILSSGERKLVAIGNNGYNNNNSFDISSWQEGYYSWGVQTIDQGYLGSLFSEAQDFTLYFDNLIDAPNNLEINNPNPSISILSWDDNSNNETGYIIERSESNQDSFQEVAYLDPNTTTYNDETISSLTGYYYRVKMTTTSSEVGYSEIKYLQTGPDIEDSPSELVASMISASEIILNWVDNNNDETNFVIESSESNSSNFKVIDTIAENLTVYLNTGLNSGTNYFYRIKAINNAGQSEYSNIGNATTDIIDFNLTDGVFGEIVNGEGMAWGDFNNDNFEDLFISSHPIALYFNNGDATFTKAENTGIEIGADEYSNFGIWGDYDNDGFLDLFLSVNDNKKRIFHNNGNSTFTKIKAGEIVNEITELQSASWNDYDNDGDLDIFITNIGQNTLYKYNGNNDFRRVLTEDHEESYGINWGDYNNDGNIDLYVGNHKKNDLYKNNGKTPLIKITDGDIVNNEDYHRSSSVNWGDYNNDGFIDMLITNSNSTKEWLYKNNGDETFTKVDGVFKYPNYYANVKTGYWFDYDNDGDLDIYLYLFKIHILYKNIGNDTFVYSEIYSGEETSYYAGFGSCYDYDNDGFNDILINRTSNQILKNEGNGNNWIKILLKGSPSNSFGIGARVMIKSGDIWQNRTVRTLGAFRSQNGNILNFGLKDAEVIDSIIVKWPMGTIQYLTDIDINQKIIINESDAEVKPLYKPSNLFAESSWGRIVVRWEDNTENEQSFIIERSINDTTNFQQHAVVAQNITIYADSSVTHSVLYFYRIKAKKGDTSSQWSNIDSTRLVYFKQNTDSAFSKYKNESKCVAWVDYDNDSLLDIFVGNADTNDILYHNTGLGTFTEILNTSITQESTLSNSGVWADYNNNGLEDLFVANGGFTNGSSSELNNNLFKNIDGGEFAKITQGEIVNDNTGSHVAAWGDYNIDGYLDIFVGSKNGQSALFKNMQNDEFLDVIEIMYTGLSATDAVWSDFDKDGDIDLFVFHKNYNTILKIIENLGNGVLQVLNLDEIGISNSISANSLNIEDFNNDGLFDFFFTVDGNNRLFINNNGIFQEVFDNDLVYDMENSFSAVCGDVNNDGYIDVFVSNYTAKNYLYLNGPDLEFTKLEFEPMSTLSGLTTSAAFGDYNKDGNIDLFVTNFGEKNNLYINQTEGKSWIVFTLSSPTNKNIIGTKIELYHNGQTQNELPRSRADEVSKQS